MPIPNISTLFQRIRAGAEGGHEFARFMNLLLTADYDSRKIKFISTSDASGDFKKVDGYIQEYEEFPQCITGFQFKFYPTKLSPNQKSEIIKSIEAAIAENNFIQEYILVTPEDFMKEQAKWFESLSDKYFNQQIIENDGLYGKFTFKLTHWGHNKIIELCLKHDHIGFHYFPELFPAGIGKFKLSNATIDFENSAWFQTNDDLNSFRQGTPEKHEKFMTSDPVFDFQFKNSSNEIYLLKSVEVHVLNTWTTLNGIPRDQFLRSVCTFNLELDFTRQVNTLKFPDPMIFESNSPKRFKIQLQNFYKNCTANNIEINFWFYFDEIVIPTDSFYLSL